MREPGEQGLKYKLYVNGAFMFIFWLPLCLLTKFIGFDQKVALIAAGIGAVPLVLLFVPLFERLASRLSGIKVGSFELSLKEQVDQAIQGDPATQVHVVTDLEREHVLQASDIQSFVALVQREVANPKKRIVLVYDLARSEAVPVPFLYFQLRHLDALFDFRAMLVIDSDRRPAQDWILGAILPSVAWQAIGRRHKQMVEAFERAVGERVMAFQGFGNMEEFLRLSWSDFVAGLGEAKDQHPLHGFEVPDHLRLDRAMYRLLLAEYVERCVLNYPLTSADYLALLGALAPSSNLIILTSKDGPLNVRSVDRVAREMARVIVVQSLRHAERPSGQTAT